MVIRNLHISHEHFQITDFPDGLSDLHGDIFRAESGSFPFRKALLRSLCDPSVGTNGHPGHLTGPGAYLRSDFS